MEEGPAFAYLAELFHAAFVRAYAATARARYLRLASRLPFHGQDVHVIHGGNRWWHVVCVPGSHSGDLRLGPVGRWTILSVDAESCPDLNGLRDQSDPRKEDFRFIVGATSFIYHEAFPLPWQMSDDELATTATTLANRLVDEHAAPLLQLEAVRSRVSSLRNATQLLRDMNEAIACMHSEHHRAAIATISAAAESALVGCLEEMGHPIRQEERGRVLGHEHHYLSGMVAEAYRHSAITIRTRDRLEILDSLRRGTDHCRPDATAQDDVAFAWATLQQLLLELAR